MSLTRFKMETLADQHRAKEEAREEKKEKGEESKKNTKGRITSKNKKK